MLRRDADDKLVKEFDLYYDDSSDEESVEEKISSYQIDDSWKQFKQSKQTFQPQKLEDNFLSFIAHVAGIKLLYSKQINLIYYPQKKTLFSPKENGTAKLSTSIENNIKSALATSFNITKEFLSHTKQKKLSDKKLDDIYQSALLEIYSAIQNEIKIYIPYFIRWLKENKYQGCLTETISLQQFADKIISLFSCKCIEKMKLTQGKGDRAAVKQALTKLAMEEFYRLSTYLKLNKKENAEGKKEAITSLESYQGTFKNLSLKILEVLKLCNARGYVENMLVKKIEEMGYSSIIMKAYIADLVNLKNKNKNALLESYFSYDKESVFDELETNLKIHIKNSLMNIGKYFNRSILSKNHLFSSNNPYMFYANVRLSSRSQKRHILNLQHAIFKNDSISRVWQMNASNASCADVLEMEEISSLNFARKDIILDIGNYEKVYSAIKQLKNALAQFEMVVEDRDIAIWLRTIFKGENVQFTAFESLNDNILGKIQAISYLLFGCEAMRNPAMIVINQMLIDLIINDAQWNFEEAFTKNKNGQPLPNPKFMPMIPEGAVSVARGLESDLRKFMPYPYFYNGIEENNENSGKFSKSDLIQAEANIVRSWLTLKNITTIKKITKEDMPNKILDLIEKYYVQWFSNNKLEKKNEFKK